MTKNRIEAFSDGVIAIIITVMVLEIKIPHLDLWPDLFNLWPIFISYALSFLYVGIYWNNHHHMFHSVEKINGKILWANLHLLFWLSLLPFSTGWMGENHFSQNPMILYGLNLLFCGVAYYILAQVLLKSHGSDSRFAKSLGSDLKGRISVILYILGIGLSFINSWIGFLIYLAVAFMWLIPDRRFEHKN